MIRAMATEEICKRLGFEAFAEVGSMELGEPLQTLHVRLGDLRTFGKINHHESLLLDKEEIVYPVVVKGNVRTAITVAKEENKWVIASLGKPNWVKTLTKLRKEHAVKSNLSLSGYFIVEIPSMYFVFLGHRKDNKVMLVHVDSHEALEFSAGDTDPLQEVFSKIINIAIDYRGGLLTPTNDFD